VLGRQAQREVGDAVDARGGDRRLQARGQRVDVGVARRSGLHDAMLPHVRPVPERPGAGQESVWAYPRPPRLEPSSRRVRVVLGGLTIADTRRALRVLETSHPPTYDIPPEDVLPDALVAEPGVGSVCEWKRPARYYTINARGLAAPHAAWSYPSPSAPFVALKDDVAFYTRAMDACYIDDELVRPQPGGFYGGWITDDVVGPFKGEPGTEGW
jgi:uncharacterized protein (DUF427 family)